MECEVIVVGAGIGGLTTAALLAARGVDVCVFERQSHVGGCVANFEHVGYTFEPTFGAYSGWKAGGTWDQIFSQLPVSAPAVEKLSPNYVVRFPGGHDLAISADHCELESEIASAFPSCADAAIGFFRVVTSGPSNGASVAQLLAGTSREFRWFIDALLQTFAQRTSETCSWQQAASTLRLATGELWSIEHGAQTLADRLAESFKRSGGALRLNSPVLRFAYAPRGTPNGVDLLSGERVIATRAIVSNLTVWDTYGKLIGLSRTERDVAIKLKKLSSWGAYLMFLGIDKAATGSLPATRSLLVYDSDRDAYDPEEQLLMLNLGSGTFAAPEEKRALTAIAFTEPTEWFSFHDDHTWHEKKDQTTLEAWWSRLHQALPRLGASVEVIETSTPQSLYEATRRRFGMIGTPSGLEPRIGLSHPFPNVSLVGDTLSSGYGLESAAASAITVVGRTLDG